MPDQESITEDKQEKETEAIQMPNWLELWKEFYFQQEKDAARIFREFICTDTFVKLIDKTLEQYLAYTKITRQQMEKMSDQAIWPTKKDVARVAELIVSLEEKVDQMESGLFDNYKKITQSFTEMVNHQIKCSEEIEALRKDLEKINKKLDGLNKKIAAKNTSKTTKKTE
ncbi:MAG: hypothetical protein ACOX0E_00770 [Syntrophomonadaceae bacterium]|jgi:polyhydroxyalkanoic acid synthase PhaR subunit